MRKVLSVLFAFFMVLIISNCKSTPDANEEIAGVYSIAGLMNNPVYEKTVTVYGIISELGIRNSPSFKVSSEGKSVNAWYGMMVNDNKKQQPKIDMSGYRNGDVVVITGTLKKKAKYVLKNHFWISSIKKK